MGQQTHPIGLRVGIYRKWVSTWYGSITSQSSSQTLNTYAITSQIFPRGGNYSSGLEAIAFNFFKRYALTSSIQTKRFIPVDFRFFKGSLGCIYGFILYIKFKL